MWSSPLPFGAASVVLGAVYMYAARAPSRYIVVNFGALVAGCLAAWLIGRRQTHNQHVPAAFTIAVAVTLLATALFAPRVSGASRWIPAAGISVQPSLMLLPAAVVMFARSPNWLSSLGMAAVGVALALQPDRAMAGTLPAGLAALWLYRRDAPVSLSFIVASCAFAATLLRSDQVPPAPFVEGVVQAAFASDPLAGVATAAALALILIPAVIGVVTQRDTIAAYAVFGAVWLATIAFAIAGNYPTPLVGYGTSGIVGYCLSSALLRPGNFRVRSC